MCRLPSTYLQQRAIFRENHDPVFRHVSKVLKSIVTENILIGLYNKHKYFCRNLRERVEILLQSLDARQRSTTIHVYSYGDPMINIAGKG